MSYSNGLGNLQNLPATTAASALQRTEGAASESKTTSSSPVTSESARRTDQTSFSSTSGLLGQALNGTDVRLPKVAALSAAIAAGTYQVSSSDVAGKMIDSLLGG